MKKQTINKTLKTAIATLLVLLVLVAAMCVTVMANETPVTPEVVSKNVSFDDNLHLYFAVPAEGIDVSNITLSVFEDAEGVTELQTPRTPALNEQDGTYLHNVNGVSCYIFRTIGIAPKLADKTIYVQAVNTVDGEEYKSEIVGYNIVTYLNEMLYKKGYITATSGKALTQKNLYLNTLDYCSWAQDLFVNYNDNDPSNDVPLFNEYNYIYVDGGTVDGEAYGFYLDGETANLAAENTDNKMWEVTKYVNGVAVVSELGIGSPLTVDENMTVKLVVDESAAAKGTIRLNSADELADTSKFAMRVGTSWENGKIKVVCDPTANTERVRIYPTGTQSGKNTLVFEADISVDPSQLNGILYFRPLLATTSGSNGTGVQISLQAQSSKNQVNVYLNGGNYAGSALVGEAGKMLDFTIRYTYEYTPAAGETAASALCTLESVNSATGETIQSVNQTTATCVAPDSVLTFETWANGTLSGTFYVDNLALYQK